ncbi:MAG: DUF3540 domain-containing protein [Melioribacteraceae bacterium]
MFSTNTQTLQLPQTKYFGKAKVLEVNKSEGLILLQIDNHSCDKSEVWSKSALPVPHDFYLGENVLATGEDFDELYIIGLLNHKPLRHSQINLLKMEDGTIAKIEKELNVEKLQLKSKTGELIFEYNTQSGQRRVNIASGDLDFVTAKGNINFISEGKINFISKQSVELQSGNEIRLHTTNAIGEELSAISLKHKKMKLNSSDIDINSKRSKIQIDKTKYFGNQFDGRIKNVKLIVSKIESIANTVIQKAENIYSSVKGLSQLKTGRMRTIVESAYNLKGKKIFIKSEEDFKVKAEKIHLG